MVKEITGDLIRDGKGLLCHQVNIFGVMGAGIAASIAERLLTPEQYMAYGQLCSEKTPEELLGTIQYFVVRSGASGRVVVNMFSQNPTPAEDGSLTNYSAMRLCLEDARRLALSYGGWEVSIPAYVGCGIAGGDWSRVKAIIEEVFAEGPVNATIIYWEREN